VLTRPCLKASRHPACGRFLFCAIALAVTVACSASATAQSVRFIRSDAPINGDGLTWTTAYREIFEALDEAATDPAISQIWIAHATYTPNRTAANNRDDTFTLVPGVTLYGGFLGNETTLAQRDPIAHPTILSGDLNHNDGPNFANITDNSRHVIVALDFNQTNPAALDGLIIRSGNADFPGDDLLGGGALFIQNAGVNLINCRFESNSAGQNEPDIGGFGGAVYNLGGTLNATDCIFTNNRGTSGGAIGVRDLNDSPVAAHFTNCDFTNNSAEHQTGGAVWTGVNPFDTVERSLSFTNCLFENNIAQYGGAIIENNIKHVRLTDCTFRNNQAFVVGGAMWHNQSGGPDQEPIVIKRCTFIDNDGADAGGALFFTATDALIVSTTFLGNSASGTGGAIRSGPSFGASFGSGDLELHNCAFTGNTAQIGGAVAALRNPLARVINCTFAANSASSAGGGGGILSDAFDLRIANSILWQNQAGGSQNQAAQISHQTGFGPLTLSHTCVQGLTGSLGGVGNIGDDPLFTDLNGPDNIPGTIDDNLSVQDRSPVIDTGNAALLPADASDIDDDSNSAEPLPLDLAGETRVQGEQVDMGALEAPSKQNQPGDANGDGSVDVDDLIAVILTWGTCANCRACPTDFDRDCDVDVDDLIAVILNWG
jgi:hypothetical protein